MIRHDNQKGMTLVELIIAMAITAIIMTGLSASIYTTVVTTQRGNDAITALHDIQNAVFQINRDAKMAGTTNLTDGGPVASNLDLEWVDSDGDGHTSSFSLSGTHLTRTYDGNTTSVSKFISSIEFSISDGVIDYYLVSSPPGRWDISRQFAGKVQLRPKS